MTPNPYVLLGLIPCVSCVFLAGYMAALGTAGWGWFLFAAIILGKFALVQDGKGDQE